MQVIFLVFDFLSRNYWSWLDHDPMASIWEKAISILAENLNSGHSYLITAVKWEYHPFAAAVYGGMLLAEAYSLSKQYS